MALTCSYLCSQELARGHSSEAKRSNPEPHTIFVYREHHHQQKRREKGPGVLEKLRVSQVVKKFLEFNGSDMFMVVFTRARQKSQF